MKLRSRRRQQLMNDEVLPQSLSCVCTLTKAHSAALIMVGMVSMSACGACGA